MGTESEYDGVPEPRIQAWATKSPGDSAILAANLTVSIGFATAAINAAVLLNGAAATAMLALIGTFWSSENFAALQQIIPSATTCLRMFAVGAFLAVVSGAFGYVSHCCYADAISLVMKVEKYEIFSIKPQNFEELRREAGYEANRGHVFRAIAIVAFAISLFVFFVGAVNALNLLLSASKLYQSS